MLFGHAPWRGPVERPRVRRSSFFGLHPLESIAMPIAFACPFCQANISVSDAAAGRRGKCPHCKGTIVVPSPGPAASSTEAPATTHARPALWRRPWVLALCGFILCFLAGAGTVAWLGRAAFFSHQQTDQQAKAESPKQSPPSTDPKPPELNPDPNAEVEKLAAGLKAKMPAERVKAAEALGRLGENAPGAAKYLCEACADEDKDVRQAALEALEKVAPKLYKPVLTLVVDGDPDKHWIASKEIEKLGDKGKPAIPLLYEHVRFGIKIASIGAITPEMKKKPPTPLPYLSFARSATPTWFKTHFATLISLAPDGKTAEVIGLAVSTDPKMYRNINNNIMHGAALDALKALAKSSPEARKSIAPIAMKGLDGLTTDVYDPVGLWHARTIEVLAECGPDAKKAIPALKKFKFHDRDNIRKAATDALEKIDK